MKLTNPKATRLFLKCNIILNILILFEIKTFAQKLPNVQTTDLWAPANIKIDGNIKDWPADFKAHNSATDLFYTMANDDKYLYVVIQERDPHIIPGIFKGGITIAVKSFGSKADHGKTVTYPVYDPRLPMYVNFRAKPKLLDSSKTELLQLDSFVRASNLRLTQMSKTIKVANIEGLDSTLSVYNDEGIKAASLFNNRMFYTIEFAISLQRLNLSADKVDKFNYQIKINEVEERGMTITRDETGNITLFKGGANAQVGQPATYFNGEYTLAKKP